MYFFQFRLCYNKCNYLPNYMHQLLLEGSRHIWTKKKIAKKIFCWQHVILSFMCVCEMKLIFHGETLLSSKGHP